ncbi:hypothetical protein [Terriglobus sp. RCC_193]|uniref:hypothetical protein n=1 Tax=Terriglobus sp. RCC_193 TaxID=3239218 RepID=UPI003524CC61
MSYQGELRSYIARIQQRLQVRAGVRGVAIFFATALVMTLVLVLLLNHYAFPHAGTVQSRAVLLAVLVVVACAGIAWPLWRMTASRAIASVEASHPELEDRLTTFRQREEEANPFVELLAADTLTRTENVEPHSVVSASTLAMFAGAGVACLAALLWMIFAAPGYVGYGASLLWRGERKAVQPLYAIAVQPGDVTVRRNSDQLITAEVTNLHPERVELFARFHSSNGWEPVAMQAIPSATGNASYQFTFTGLPEDVEYYVTAGPLTSEHHTVRVADLAAVKSVKVTYHYPAWTGLKTETQEHAGDLRAIEGTQAELQIEMDRPLKDGNLSLDDGRTIHLQPVEGNRYKGTIAMAKDGAYHVAGTADGKPVRLSEDYFIATDKAEPPQIAIEKPGRDYRASPIEEVTIGVKGGAQFGLRDMHLHYSVNGGPDKDIAILNKPGARDADGKYTLRLEDFKMQPGDLISLYATARDGHAESRTDISFIQADPFEREFSQSQQGGGGGGGGGQQGSNQTDISRRQKELIEQTWKQINDKTATEKTAKAQGDFLSGAQSKLRDQVNALSVRVNSRDLSEANEEFTTFDKAMQEAAKNMLPASEKLAVTKWQGALASEQKALQALLRAEATFRQIQVAFGQQGGGGGGGGNSTGRDLASLFDLELDTEKNQYETARTSSPQEEHQKQVEDALAKLDALAKRQEELAQQQKNPQQAFQERWQQEMLRREAEQLQRQMEQIAQNNQNGQQGSSQSGQQGQSSSQGGQSSSQRGQQGSQQNGQGTSSSGNNGQQQARSSSSGSQGSADQRIEQALNRVRSASDAMKRAGAPGANSSSAEAQRQAAERLREATGLLGGAQQNLAGNRMGQLSREADRIQQEEKAQAQRVDDFTKQTQNHSFNPQDIQNFMRQRNQLASDRQELSDSLSKLQKNMRDAASGMASNQPDAAKKVRDALSEMDNSDLDNRMQRSADWLRSGINPNSNGTEKGIADGLSKLSQQLHAASGAVGSGNGQRTGDAGKPDQTAALGQVARLRSQLQAMQASRQGNGLNRGGSGQQGNDSQNRNGQQGQGQQQGNGSQQGGGAQSGQNGGGQSGNAQTAGNRSGGALTRGNSRDGATDDRGGQLGDLGNRVNAGGGNRGTVFGGVNTGNNTYAGGGTAVGAKDTSDNPADTERNFQQSLRQLQALRGMVRDDPQAQKDLAELTRQMQNLDPKRFPGNPAMVEQMHSDVLRTVDRLELELQRSGETTAHTGTPQTIPAGYSDSVADYYRRLSKNSSR